MADSTSIIHKVLGIDQINTRLMERLSRERLLQLFSNCLYLGQWRLCVGCYSTQRGQNAASDISTRLANEENIELVIRALVDNPYCSSLGSPSILSPHHLSWLALQEVNHLFEKHASDVKYRDVELRLLLVEVNDRISNGGLKMKKTYKLSKVFGDIYQHHDEVVVKDDVVQFLIEIACNAPFLGHGLLSVIANHRLTFQVMVASLNQVLDEVMIYQLPARIDLKKRCDDAISRLYNLLILIDVSEENSEQLKTVQSIFVAIVDAVVFCQMPIDKNTVLSCLFRKQTPVLVRLFMTLLSFAERKLLTESCISNADLPTDQSVDINFPEMSAGDWNVPLAAASGMVDSKQISISSSDDLLPTVIALLSDLNRLTTWYHLYLLCCKYHQHPVDLIMVTCSQLIDYRLFDHIKLLFNSEEFTPMRHLMAIACLGSKRSYTVSDAGELLKCVLSNGFQSHDNKALYTACRILMRQTEVAEWFAKVTSHVDSNPQPSGLDLFQGLDLHSGLNLLQRTGYLSRLDPDLVINALDTCPSVFIVEDGEEGEINPSNYETVSDSAIYRGFLALDGLKHAISSSAKLQTGLSHGESQVSARITSSGRHIKQISPLEFRLEILEDAFALIFMRKEDLKESTGKNISFYPDATTTLTSRDASVDKDLSGQMLSQSTSTLTCGQKDIFKSLSESSGRDGRLLRSSFTSCEGEPCGFLASAGAMREMLLMIQDSLYEIDGVIEDRYMPSQHSSLTTYGDRSTAVPNDKDGTLLERIHRLREHVVEALWRLCIVSSSASTWDHQSCAELTDSDDVSESSSVSGTSTGVRQCRHHRLGSDHRYFGRKTSNVVSKMLNNSDGLLTICLREDRLTEAAEILWACQISDSSLISELDFVPKYRMLLDQLASTEARPVTDIVKIITEPNIKDLGRLISVSQYQYAGDIMRNFFQTTAPPSLSSLSKSHSVSAEKLSPLFDSAMLSSMVSFDVAVVAEVQTSVSLDLLCSSRSSLADVVTVRSSQTGFGICSFADYLVSVIGQSSESGTSIAKLLSLVTSPVNADWIKAYRMLLDCVAKIMKQASKLHVWHYSIKSGYCLEVLLIDAVKMCETYLPRGGLVPLLIDPVNKQPAVHWNYVSQMQMVLKVLADNLTSHVSKSGDGNGVVDYAKVLQRSPLQWFGELILDHGVHPEMLESSATVLNVNLVESVVSQMLSGAFVNTRRDCDLPPPVDAQSQPQRNIGKLVLNDCFSQNQAAHISSHPDSVTRELLLNLIRRLKPWCQSTGVLEEHQLEEIFIAERLDIVLSQTCRLRDVDLDLLTDTENRQERISFYLNLIALLSLHAIFIGIARRLYRKREEVYSRMLCAEALPFWKLVLQFIDDPLSFVIDRPPCRSIDRALYESVMAYRVGQLGIVSLYDLKYVITRKSSSNPPSALDGLTTARHCPLTSYNHWFQYGSPDEPLLPFSMFSVYKDCPPLQIMYPEMLCVSKAVGRRPLLIRNASAYLSKTVHLDPVQKTLVVPELLFDCAPDIAGRNHEIACITMLVPCLKTLLSSPLLHGEVKVSKRRPNRVQLRFDWYSVRHIPTADWQSASNIPIVDHFDVTNRRVIQLQPWYASCDFHALTDARLQEFPSGLLYRSSLAEALVDPDVCLSACSASTANIFDHSVKRKRLSTDSLSYLRSHAEVWAVLCALSSDRQPQGGSSARSAKPAQADSSDSKSLEFESFLCQSLKDKYPELGRCVMKYGSHLISRHCNSEFTVEGLSSTSRVPHDFVEILFRSFSDRRLHELLFERTTRAMSDSGYNDVINQLGILPTTTVRDSLLWTALHDFAMTCVILTSSSSVMDVVNQISALHDPFLRSRLCLKFATLKQFDRRVLYDTLGQFSADLDAAEMNSVIRTCIMELTFHDEFLNLIQTQSLTTMYGKVELLCEMKKFDLARKFIDQTGRGTEDHCVVDKYIIGELLKDSHVLREASFLQILERMKLRDRESCLDICMTYCSEDSPPEQIVFFAKFVLRYLKALLSTSQCATLHTRLIGYKALVEMSAEIQKELCSHCRLPESPLLLLEQLLMNEKIDCAMTFVNVLREYELKHGSVASISLAQCDELIERYSRLALNTDWSHTDNKPGSLLRSLSRMSTVPDTRTSRTLTAMGELSSSTQLNTSLTHKSVSVMPSINELFRMPVRPPSRAEWVPDTQSNCCVYCQQQFTLFCRRHHCRRCGRLLCGDCCDGKLLIDGELQRACSRCCKETHRQQSVGDAEVLDWLHRQIATELCPDSAVGPDSLSSVRLQTEWNFLLMLDDQYNKTVRDEFSYDHAPSCSLAMSILRLHSDRLQCGRFIVTLVDEMMHKIASTVGTPADNYDRNFIIQIAESLLLDAKLKFAEDGRQAIFDDYLDRLKLIRLLVANKSSIIPDICDLGNSAMRSPVVSKLLRSLIKTGQFELAMSVCNACNLNKLDLMAAWGLTELRIGGREYWKSARDRFKLYYQLKPSPSKNELRYEHMVENIVKILTESKSNSILDELAAIKLQLTSSQDLSSCFTPKVQMMDLLDEPTYRECLFYIERYGTYVQHIKFMTDWCHIRVSCKTFLQLEDVSSNVFIEALVMPCLNDGGFQRLFASLKSVDPSLDSYRKHLVATYEYFMKTKQHKLAYIFQDFLKDHEKAAMTCINGVYMSVVSKYSQQLVTSTTSTATAVHCLEAAYDELTKYGSYLEKAKQHLKGCCVSGSATASSVDNLRSHLMKATYQDNLMKLLKKGKTRPVHGRKNLDKMSSCLAFIYDRYRPTTVPCIFGNAKSQMLAVQLMLMLEYEAVGQQPIAVEVMTALKLNEYSTVLGAACYLVRHLPLFEVFITGFFPEMYQKIGVQTMEQNIDDFYSSLAFSLLVPDTGSVNTDPKCVIYIADQICNRNKRFEVYMAGKLYESAFVCATTLRDTSLVQQIYDVKDIPRKMALACKAYLDSHQQLSDQREQHHPRAADSRPSDW